LLTAVVGKEKCSNQATEVRIGNDEWSLHPPPFWPGAQNLDVDGALDVVVVEGIDVSDNADPRLGQSEYEEAAAAESKVTNRSFYWKDKK
jgi:hypothetical protein